MKTSKKILALILALSLVFSITAISASAKYVYKFEDGQWENWDENGNAVYTVNIAFSEGSASINWLGAITPSKLHNAEINATSNRYKVSGTITVPGTTPYEIKFENAPITGSNDGMGINTIWFTSILPFNGEIAQQMIAEAETDEVLRSMLYVEDEVGVICKDSNKTYPIINGETSTISYTNLSKKNLFIYLGYKVNGADGEPISNIHNSNVEVTLSTPYVKDYNVPVGTFFIDEQSLITFPYNWAEANVHYKWGNSTIIVPAKDSASGEGNLDLAYGVFEAPVTGEYQVYAYKRDRADTAGLSSNRNVAININGTVLNFTQKNCPYAADADPAYYWEEDVNGNTITLTKGQKFAVRIDRSMRLYPGCLGFAFVPVSADFDVADMQAIASALPKSAFDFGTYSMPAYVESATKATVTVMVNETPVTVTADCSNDAFPNSRVYDQGGNFIEGVTLLDALYAADANDDNYALTAATWDSANKKLLNGNVVQGVMQGMVAKVNGNYVYNTDQYELEEGDVITCGPSDITRVTVNGHGGASAAWSDTVAGVNGTTSKFNLGSLKTTNHFVEDYTELNAYADTYLTGYLNYKVDQADTSGDETLVLNRVCIPIVASAMKADGVTLQLGHKEENLKSGVTVDGLRYRIGVETQKLNSDQDVSTLVLAKNKFPDEATISMKETYNGVIAYTDAPVVMTTIVVTKNDSGAVLSTKMNNVIVDPLEAVFVPVAKNQTVYFWYGGKLITGTSAIPVCAPISR